MQEHFKLKLIGSKDADFLQIVHVGWNEVDGVVEDRVLDLVRRPQHAEEACVVERHVTARLEEAEEIVKRLKKLGVMKKPTGGKGPGYHG
ncbi:hypothetical protein K1719_022633 [Acacia pycnantha]|nr:hypothetical protein K1719_022633 [Acacia pycnantha]